MAHAIRRVVRGPSTKVNAYAGPAGELVMDTTTNDLVLETGMAGGVRMAKASTAISATNGVEVTVGGTLGEATTISGVDATTSVKGVVQLSGATNGTSQTKAATEKAVADALQAAKDYTDTHGGSGGKTYTGTAPIVVNNTSDTISINDATSSAKGVVQLSNSTTGTSQTVAATEKAVADALTAAKSYADTHGKTYTGSSPVSVSGTTISVASASTSAAGVVQLNNSTSSTSQTQAATPKAVSDALAAAKTVTSEWHSGANWYRVFSDGWIEQGGEIVKSSSGSENITVTMNKAFSNTNYTLVFSFVDGTYTGTATPSYYMAQKISSSTFKTTVNGTSGLSKKDWFACGF